MKLDIERRVREAADVLVVVDRVDSSDSNRGRLADAIATAFNEGEGVAVALDNGSRQPVLRAPDLLQLRGTGAGTHAQSVLVQ